MALESTQKRWRVLRVSTCSLYEPMKKSNLIRHTLAYLLIILFISANANSEYDFDLSAANILEKVDTNYSNIESYRDWGIVETDSKQVIFQTHFVRPNFFLFKWGSALKIKNEFVYADYDVIWSNNEGVYTLHNYDKPDSEIEKEINIGMAVAGATGSSLMAAYIVGSLLMDEPDGWLVGGPNQPAIVGIEKIRGNNCYHIKDVHPRTGTEYHLWIDVQSFLIQKVTTNWPDMEFETNFCEIFVNENIDLNVFDFKRYK